MAVQKLLILHIYSVYYRVELSVRAPSYYSVEGTGGGGADASELERPMANAPDMDSYIP